jgi:diguanylate cyclase (GGDEF)-like protein/PAS domain S-box-containing protein
MRRWRIAGAAVLVGAIGADLNAAAAPASSPSSPIIQTLGQLRALPPAEAGRHLPVRITAVVTYYHHEWEMVFVQDEFSASFAHVDHRGPPIAMAPGTLVEVTGKTQAGDFEPSILDTHFRPIKTVGLPAPFAAGMKEIATGAQDARWIEVEGVVHSAAVVDDLLNLVVKVDGGKLKVYVKDWQDKPDFRWIVDSTVRLRGVCTTLTNEHRQFVGAELWTPDWSDIEVVQASPADPWSTESISMGELRRYAFAGGHDARVRVAGTVTLRQPGRGVFLQDDTDGVFVQTAEPMPLAPGDRVLALGFVAPGGQRPTLEDGWIRRLSAGPVPPPVAVTADRALSGDQDSRLIRVKGRFVGHIVSGGEPAFVLQDGDVVFNARLQHQEADAEPLPAPEPGSLVAVVGVCSVPAVEAGAPKAFQVLLRGASDLTVLERPSWWTVERVQGLLGIAAGLALLALGWAAVLRRRVSQQTEVIRRRLEREAALEKKYRDLIENANDLVFSLDSSGRFTSINAAAERILGYAPPEILGKALEDVAAGRHKILAREASTATTEDGVAHRYELDVVGKDGRRAVLEVNARARRQENGAVGIEGIARDITERKRADEELRRKEDALRESQQRFALAVRGTNDGVWDWDLHADRVYYSPRWKSMLGYTEEEVGDSPADWFRLVHAEDLDRLTAKLTAHRDGSTPHFEHEHRMLHKDGAYRWVLNRGFALRDEDGRAYRMAGAQTDVTDRRAYDALTGLPNKALFVERLEKAVSRSRGAGGGLFAVLFLDLDRFKFVNDSLGHLAGDRLLVTFAQRLEGCVRPGDMIARFGGDEFAILVDDIEGAADAARVAERVQKALASPFNLGGPEVYSSCSIGIALSSTGYDRAEDLLRDADTAMYRAKAGGRARFEVFDGAMREHVTAFMRTQNDLRRALERDELRVHYQPIVELTTGAVNAFEALVRWQHPERGLLGPGDFVDVAEETGLIVSVGEWVLRRACRQARAWRDRFPGGAPLLVSVNLSARQVNDPDLVARVREALADSQLDPATLALEITESAIMETADSAVAKIAGIKDLGVRLHLDDFGTGYSSLSYLHRFPIDVLKIDRSFVSTMMGSDEARAIVRSILNLADSLRLSVIAEGVETEEQSKLLCGLGCPQAQGHHFSAALEPAMAANLVSAAARGGFSLGRRSGVA